MNGRPGRATGRSSHTKRARRAKDRAQAKSERIAAAKSRRAGAGADRRSVDSTPDLSLLPADLLSTLGGKSGNVVRRAAIREHVYGAIDRELAAVRARIDKKTRERIARKNGPVEVLGSREEWTPAALSRATGYTISHVTRMFHADPKQRRWYVQAVWLRDMHAALHEPGAFEPTVDFLNDMLIAHGSSVPLLHGAAVGFKRFAQTMQITVAELVGIVIGD